MLDGWNTVVHIEEFFIFSASNFLVIRLYFGLTVKKYSKIITNHL